MTKRACPFDYHVRRQLKIHLNDFEMDENLLKTIKEETMTKLIDGSKKFYSNGCNVKNFKNDQSQFGLVPACDGDKKFMQKCVTNYFTVNGKLNELNSKNLPRPAASSRCSFCDVDTDFLHKCTKCTEHYCNSCCFINYESVEDTRTCMSCS